MPKETQDLTHEPVRDGWLVEVSLPRLHGTEPTQILFAAAIEEAHTAVDAVRQAIGGLHCAIEAKCRLSPRALAQLAVSRGNVKSF